MSLRALRSMSASSVHVRAARTGPTQTVAAAAAKLKKITVKARPITPESFKPFGQVIGATDDGKMFDDQDADLVLDNGTPRFYIMRLPKRGRSFTRITYHAQVTQCLGSLFPGHWYMVVSPPSGSVEAHPTESNITAFKIPHGVFVKMHQGTWHAGPLFEDEFQDFYNLELKDTNVVDHNTYDFSKDGLEVVIEDEEGSEQAGLRAGL